MAKSIVNVSTTDSATDLTPRVFDLTKFHLVDTVTKGLDREFLYQYIGNDKDHPMTVRVGIYKNPAANGGLGQTNISTKISTYTYDDETETYAPFVSTHATSGVGDSGIIDEAQYMAMLENHLSLYLPGPYVDGAADGSVVAKLAFAVPII